MIKLYNIDCMEFMKDKPDNYYKLAIVDPPYGINADKAHNAAAESRIRANGKSKAGRGWVKYKDSKWDDQKPNKQFFKELFRVSENQIIWGGNYFSSNLEDKMGWIVWNKMQRNFSLADGELAWTSFNKALRIFDMSRSSALSENNDGVRRFHPTQKPVSLYKWILKNYAKKGDNILDTHIGSGSIAIACHDMGFDLDGCELDTDYFNSASRRVENHMDQGSLF